MLKIAASAFFAFSSSAYAANVMISLDDRAPFHFPQADGSAGGMAVPTLRCALEAVGDTPVFEFTSWKRAQALVQRGEMHAFFAASQNSDRDTYATITDTFIPQAWNWYSSQADFDPSQAATLQSAKVGALYGYNATKWVKKQGANVISEDEDIRKLLKLVKLGRLDAIFAPNMIVQAALEEDSMGLDLHEVVGVKKPMGAYFSNNFLQARPGFIDELNAALANCG